MIDFSDKTAANLQQAQLSRVTEQIDKREGSLIQTAIGPASYALEDAYLDLARIQKNGFVQTATGQALDYKAMEAGLTRYPATAAIRRGVFNCSVPDGSRFAASTGTESYSFIADGTLDDGGVRLRCQTVGTIGNDYTGDLLAISYIPNLTQARVTDILIPGQDEESDDALRQRYLEYVRDKPFGGNIADYRTHIGQVEGVGGVQIYPTWNGGGTVKCVIIGADFLPAGQALLQTVQNVIDPLQSSGQGYGLAPIGAQVTITAPEQMPIDITAQITVSNGVTISQLQEAIKNKLEEYLISLRKAWATPNDILQYNLTVYRARILATILAVNGVINVENLLLNNTDADIKLTQSGACQQIPVLGRVELIGN